MLAQQTKIKHGATCATRLQQLSEEANAMHGLKLFVFPK